ncbi:MAG: hypothetical protein IPL50_07585 [Chitinophagaceae bacterium]|nr:hypothetical protein [Chitinophagaceae bacterium]
MMATISIIRLILVLPVPVTPSSDIGNTHQQRSAETTQHPRNALLYKLLHPGRHAEKGSGKYLQQADEIHIAIQSLTILLMAVTNQVFSFCPIKLLTITLQVLANAQTKTPAEESITHPALLVK